MVEQYATDPGVIAAVAASVRAHWQAHGRGERLLMSFHGIPQRLVDDGDPYSGQCHATAAALAAALGLEHGQWLRSEEHTSELQSLMRNSYAVFCLKKKKQESYT